MKTGRRSFIKGSVGVGVPLVLTVGPGSAIARSSNQACLSRDADRANAGMKKPVVMTQIDADDWLRVQVDLVELSVWQGAELKALPGKYFLGTDKSTYWRLDE